MAHPDDADAFREALRAADFDSTRGDFAFGPNHHPMQDIYVREVVKEHGDGLTNVIVGTALEDHADAYAASAACKAIGLAGRACPGKARPAKGMFPCRQLFLIEQLLNGLQFGVMLFLMAAGLTLIFGVMGLINLAHGSLYMIGAFAAAGTAALTGSFWLALAAALMAAAIVGAIVEMVVIRRLYDRDHLDQVLATFALILIFSEGTRFLFGSLPLYLDTPRLPVGADHPARRHRVFRFTGSSSSPWGWPSPAGLFWLIARTRLGIRSAPAKADREMIGALGVDIRKLYTLVFALGAALAGLAGAMIGAIQAVEVGMGEPVLILAFVVIVIGGIGSIKGAFVGALLVGLTDTLGRVLLPQAFGLFMDASSATTVGASLASMSIYILMAGSAGPPLGPVRGARVMRRETASQRRPARADPAGDGCGRAPGGRALYHHAGDPAAILALAGWG